MRQEQRRKSPPLSILRLRALFLPRVVLGYRPARLCPRRFGEGPASASAALARTSAWFKQRLSLAGASPTPARGRA